MPYSTTDDQKNEIPLETIKQLVCDEGVESLTYPAVVARVSQVIDESDSEIDAMLSAGGYTTPVTTPAAALVLLRSWSKGITAYKLYKRKDEVPEVRQKEYDRINRLLEKVGAGGGFQLPAKPADSATDFASGSLITSHFE